MMLKKQRTIPRWLAAVIAVALFTAAPSAAQGPSQRTYVANANTNQVSVIDSSTPLVATIDVGIRPARVAITGDGKRAYVINAGSNSVSVIDTSAIDSPGAVVAKIDLGDEPSGLAVAPDGKHVYVLGVSGLFEVIERAAQPVPEGAPEYLVVKSFMVGTGGGGELAATPDKVYIASGSLWVVDALTNALLPDCVQLAAHGFATFPVAIAVAPNGNAYVSVVTYSYGPLGFGASGEIQVVDRTTNTLTATIPLYSQPGAVAFTPEGKYAYVTIRSFWANTGYGAAFLPGRWVAKIDTMMNTVVKWIDLGNGAPGSFTPAGIAVTPDRARVYVALPGNGSVASIDAAVNAVTEYIADADGPSGVASVPDASAILRTYVVDAVDDGATTPLAAVAGGGAAGNVLANDTIDGTPAAIGNVTLSLVASDSDGITLDTTTGALRASAATPAGTHAATYRICEAGNASNCDEAIVTLSVRARYQLLAGNDGAEATAGALAPGSVLDNDTLAGLPAGLATVSIALVEGDAGLRLDPATGSLRVADAASAGAHVLRYRVCEIADPGNCSDPATVTVLVRLPALKALGDTATAPRTGAMAVVNVLANDTLEGSAVSLSRVTVRVASVPPPAGGLTLNEATGAISVAAGTAAGDQSLTYRICEIVRPDNCSDATATVTVAPYVVKATNDSARASSKNAATAVVNVLANDSIGGVRATAANVKLSLVSLAPANRLIRLNADGTVDVLAKAGGGSYALLYEICEAGNPGNCARATLTLDLSGR